MLLRYFLTSQFFQFHTILIAIVYLNSCNKILSWVVSILPVYFLLNNVLAFLGLLYFILGPPGVSGLRIQCIIVLKWWPFASAAET